MVEPKYRHEIARVWYTVGFLILVILFCIWFTINFGYREYKDGKKAHTELYKLDTKKNDRIKTLERFHK